MSSFCYIKKISFHLFAAFNLVALTGCTKFCLNSPEIGSKSNPIQFYLNETLILNKDDSILESLQFCIEEKTGYKIEFIVSSDEKEIISAIGRGHAQFALLSPLSYIGATHKIPLFSLALLSQNGSVSNRSIFIAKAKKIKYWFKKHGYSLPSLTLPNELTLNYLNNSTIAYSSPESEVGFLVPRFYLLQRNVFPNSAIFAGNDLAVLEAIDQDLADIGIISETFFNAQFPNFVPVQVNSMPKDYFIISISPALPSNVIVQNTKNLEAISSAISVGFEHCAQEKNSEFKKIFNAESIQNSNEKLFSFVKELYIFQQENIRILTPRNP